MCQKQEKMCYTMMCKGRRSWIERISDNSLRKIEEQIGIENTDVRTENMGKTSECVHIQKKNNII